MKVNKDMKLLNRILKLFNNNWFSEYNGGEKKNILILLLFILYNINIL